MAVLSRVNALLAPVQVALVGEGIPISGGVGLEFADRTAVRTVLAWLRLAVAGRGGSFAADDIREALKRPSRSFHPRITDWVAEQTSVVDLHRLAGRLTNERDAERVVEFAADVQTLQKAAESGATTSDLVLMLIDEIGLAGSVASLDANRRGMNRSAQGDDLTAVQHLAALHDDARGLREVAAVATRRQAGARRRAAVDRAPREGSGVAARGRAPRRRRSVPAPSRRRRGGGAAAVPRGDHEGESPCNDRHRRTAEPVRCRAHHRAIGRPIRAPGRLVAPPRTEGARPLTTGAGDPAADLDAEGQRRFEALRELRGELRDGKPAYVVFDNKTLAAIAREAPTTLRDLGRISGVGPAKLERYGDPVIELMARLTST